MTNLSKKWLLLAFTVFGIAYACEYFGEYNCDDECEPDEPMDIETITFIRAVVNLDVPYWGPCDVVDIYNSDGYGGTWGRGSALSPHELIAPLPRRPCGVSCDFPPNDPY